MNDLGITPNDRKVTVLARQKEEETGEPALALELPNGEMVTGKTSDLFGPTAALLINAIKKLAHIDKETKINRARIRPTDTRLEDQSFG